ncbi:serine hydrolase domain-containing protein [Dactylosporangium sp. AC04546]|uniref:serine hydrolase domain-containing protein n=1 Tax=Dactylosporangium sp. AC04546 TaxID=2862460 RepID=UPI001EE0953D|nr:serine hydrolase domain-containing protein [Dactylosporangium sp. AC04546]WVK79788.1 serine hydrolase domain-containing protein [Dactylosporangium sp. AC04546]
MLDWSGTSGGPALDRARRLVRERGGAAQLVVVHGGRVVADVAHGCAADDLFWVFSTSKPFTALLVHRLAERGALALDDPLARHWPAFGAHGKEAITVRHVLQHRSGLPVARGSVADALTMADWNGSVRALERARPRFPAGGGPAYQYLTYGFLLGELLRRITGTPIRELMTEEILAPLGLRDTYLGVPDAALARQVPLRARGPAGRATQVFVNRRETRQAVIPAAGISTTARDLAVLYQALLDGGAPLLTPQSLAAATMPTSDGTVDAFIKLPIRWSQGFQLGGPGLDPDRPRPMGRTSSPQAFGHNGSNVCVAWADPARRLVVACLTNRVESRTAGAAAHNAVAEAILAEFPTHG